MNKKILLVLSVVFCFGFFVFSAQIVHAGLLDDIWEYLFSSTPTGYVIAEGESCSPAGSSSCSSDGDTQLYCYTCTEADLTNHAYCKLNNHVAGDTLWQYSQKCSTTNRRCESGTCKAICGDGICGTYEKYSNCEGIYPIDCLVASENGYCSNDFDDDWDGTTDCDDSDCSSDSACIVGTTTCANGAIPGNGACMCNDVTYNTGYCCDGVYSSSTPCSTTAPQCMEGEISSSGCICGGYAYISGYCCNSFLTNSLVWTNVPCTQTCTSAGGVCCSGSVSDCDNWSNKWATDCQGYVCCVGTCTGLIYYPETSSCTEQGGIICDQNVQECQGQKIGSGDSAHCCLGTCYPPLETLTCSEQNGNICTGSQTCSIWLNASDTEYCCSGTCITPPTANCSDSDAGKDYYTKGFLEGYWNTTLWDYCDDANTLREYYCEDGSDVVEIYTCPNGCQDGVCITTGEAPPSTPITTPPTDIPPSTPPVTPPTTAPEVPPEEDEEPAPPGKLCTPNSKRCLDDELQGCTVDGMRWNTIQSCEYGCNPVKLQCKTSEVEVCTDSDNGSNLGVRGTTYGLLNNNYTTQKDFCVNETTLTEYICIGNKMGSDNYNCENGCENGRCIPAENVIVRLLQAILEILKGLFGDK